MLMTKTPLLKEVLEEKLSNIDPNDDEISSLFQEQEYDPENLTAFVSESLLRARLKQICLASNGRLIFNPIQNGNTTNYEFRRQGEKTTVLKRDPRTGNRMDYSEIDALILMCGLPVLFEIKIQGYKNDNKRGIKKAMRKERVSYLLDPIREYFKTPHCSYVLMVPESEINPESQPFIGFAQQNGIIIPWCKDRHEYRKRIQEIESKKRTNLSSKKL